MCEIEICGEPHGVKALKADTHIDERVGTQPDEVSRDERLPAFDLSATLSCKECGQPGFTSMRALGTHGDKHHDDNDSCSAATCEQTNGQPHKKLNKADAHNTRRTHRSM
jgi:hypothetical protein